MWKWTDRLWSGHLHSIFVKSSCSSYYRPLQILLLRERMKRRFSTSVGNDVSVWCPRKKSGHWSSQSSYQDGSRWNKKISPPNRTENLSRKSSRSTIDIVRDSDVVMSKLQQTSSRETTRTTSQGSPLGLSPSRSRRACNPEALSLSRGYDTILMVMLLRTKDYDARRGTKYSTDTTKSFVDKTSIQTLHAIRSTEQCSRSFFQRFPQTRCICQRKLWERSWSW